MPWTKDSYRDRPFLTVDYVLDSQGKLKVSKPAICPEAEKGVAGDCWIIVHAYRERKCGPGFKLLIFMCKNHNGSFTAYPEGWTPFARRSLIGEESTYEAVEDLSSGTLWPVQATNNMPTRKTQIRWLTAWSIIIGVCPELSQHNRHNAALALGIQTLLLKEKADQIRAGPMVSRALSCRSVLSSVVPNHNTLVERGENIGYWGKQYRSTRFIGS